jgi:hypothetical protein
MIILYQGSQEPDTRFLQVSRLTPGKALTPPSMAGNLNIAPPIVRVTNSGIE